MACGAKGRVARGGCLEGDGSRNEAHPRRSVFVGEMDTNISFLAPYAYPLRGRRVFARFPRQLRWEANPAALLAGMSIEGTGVVPGGGGRNRRSSGFGVSVGGPWSLPHEWGGSW